MGTEGQHGMMIRHPGAARELISGRGRPRRRHSWRLWPRSGGIPPEATAARLGPPMPTSLAQRLPADCGARYCFRTPPVQRRGESPR